MFGALSILFVHGGILLERCLAASEAPAKEESGDGNHQGNASGCSADQHALASCFLVVDRTVRIPTDRCDDA